MITDSKNSIKMGQKVKPNDNVTVYGTGASKHYAAGKERQVHRILAQQLIAKGVATETKPEGKANSKPSKKTEV